MVESITRSLCSSERLARILTDPAMQAYTQTYAAGEIICDPAAQAHNVYLIESGEVRLFQVREDGNLRLMYILGGKQWFGVSAVADLPHHLFRGIAAKSSKIVCAPGRLVREALARDPEVMTQVLQHMVLCLGAAAEETSQMASDDCRNRLLHTLVKFSGTVAATSVEEGVVLRMTHEQLASAVGAARETVSLALTELREANLLHTGRNRLTFNPEALEQFARERHTPSVAVSPSIYASHLDASNEVNKK